MFEDNMESSKNLKLSIYVFSIGLKKIDYQIIKFYYFGSARSRHDKYAIHLPL
jgi:hypothetical protein